MRVPSPRVLLACSAVLFAVVAVGILLTRPQRRTAPPPAPPPPPVTIAAGAYEAAVSAPPGTVVRWGPAGTRPLLRTTSGLLTGLAPNTRYVALVGGRRLAFTTAAVPETAAATARHGVLRVDGAPVFPLIAWQECPDRWTQDVDAGVTLFAGDPCTGLPSLVAGVAGRALVAGTSDDTPGVAGPIGWFLQDEADARGLTGTTVTAGGPGLRFLTLTSHFFAGAAPLPGGRGMYRGLVARADVVGFDLYPLQELCRPDLLPWDFDAQQALRRLAPGKPTFQWIEVRELGCPQPEDAVTPATIRVESWLAIAGGATGLGFFPGNWDPAATAAIRGVARRIRQLGPALLRPPLPVRVEPADAWVRASARRYGGTTFTIAVNAGTAAAAVALDGRRVVLAPRSVRILRR
ncbi:MAG TPA: hypothetical protein VFL60_00615 [Gaiellaceae bacterium]|nr:hypothetical protein [Gaiellaceae bacterium]